MPEGPDLNLASVYVNTQCAGLIFTGVVEKSEVSKGAVVPFSCDAYRISASSRGKEVRLTLTPVKSDTKSKGKSGQNQEPMDVIFRFGMSGIFRFTKSSELPKHAHLRFYTKEVPQRVLSFVDTRRFGSWHPNTSWQPTRGPCAMFEYKSFRDNVLSNLSDSAFDRPICEALLNQKYFNGIGNYLRAEILYRSNIPPFMKARTVLEGLGTKNNETQDDKEEITVAETSDADMKKKNTERPDLLSLCHTVPLEVVNLGKKGYDPEKAYYVDFQSWVQCYNVDGMRSLKDRDGRTIWFKGDPGPMAPKASKSLKRKRKIQKDEHVYTNRKEKSIKKEPVSGKMEKDMYKKHSGNRKRHASKKGHDAGATDEKKGLGAQRQGRSAGVQNTRAKRTRRSVGEGNAKAKGTRKTNRKTRSTAN